jgi:hypothetical protein
MNIVKLNGVLEKLLSCYPNVDLVGFLQDELQLPVSKAEILAQRIEKRCCQCFIEPRTNFRRILLTPLKDLPCLQSEYSVDCLSDNEFGHFILWLLEASGYKICHENRVGQWGVDFTAEKDGDRFVIVARKYPKDVEVSEAIFILSEKAKQVQGCKKSIVVATSYFSAQANAEAQRLGVVIWDKDAISDKIAQVRRKDAVEVSLSFPDFSGSLLDSLLRLEELKDFIIERRSKGKFELFLAGVKFPLLTFQVEGGRVTRCVYRMRNYTPVGESEAQALIWTDHANIKLGPDGAEAYDAVTRYLKEFIE